MTFGTLTLQSFGAFLGRSTNLEQMVLFGTDVKT